MQYSDEMRSLHDYISTEQHQELYHTLRNVVKSAVNSGIQTYPFEGLPTVPFGRVMRVRREAFLLAMGAHRKVVQEILGHAQISMTMDTYSHMLPTMQREAMEGLDNLFGDAE